MTLMEWLSIGTAAITGIVAAVSTVAFMRGRLSSLLEYLQSMERRMEERIAALERRIDEAHRRIDDLIREFLGRK